MRKYPIDQILRPVSKFIHLEFTGGIILFISVLTAIIWVNSGWADSYHGLWETHLGISFSGYHFDQPLHVWINDGLMALFFFVIGLELKREFIAGELSSVSKAALPMVAALGGMLVPAGIYYLFNFDLASSKGWGIPTATDIAFALGLLSLAGKQIPSSVKVFLSALAVADDLGAVLVIAVFYTSHFAFIPLIIGCGVLLLLWLGNWLGIRNSFFYLLLGIVVWYLFLISGVHATIAGVLVAFVIPARTKVDEAEYLKKLDAYAADFEAAIPQNGSLTSEEQHRTIEQIKQLSLDAETPLQKIEYGLHPWVAFLIMPLFAVANAGIAIGEDFFSALINPVSMGVALGLVLGKFAGVFGAVWLMVRLGPSELPYRSSWRHMAGTAMLAGVGFTMSLFITNLAFTDAGLINNAKYGILLASVVSGIGGVLLLKYPGNKS